MTFTAMLAALSALLLTPGPTNTLLALAGAEHGWRAALRLVPLEIAAYLAVALPLAVAGVALEAHLPALRPLLAGVAGVWVMVLAARMWHLPTAGSAPSVSGGRVFLTTLLNPKGLVIGLVLLPGPQLGLRVVALAVLIGLVAAFWAALGARLAGGASGPAPRGAAIFRRLAAVWLGVLSLGLIYSAAHAAL